MSRGQSPREVSDPTNLWKQWYDATSGMWPGAKGGYLDPFGLYRQWFENSEKTEQGEQAQPADLQNFWRLWTEATSEASRRAAVIGETMIGLAPRWASLSEEVSGRMLEDGLPTDPMDFYMRWYNATSGPLSEIAGDLLENEDFLEDSRRLFEAYASSLRIFQRASEESLALLRLPTSSDHTRLAELVVTLHDKVDRLEEAFEDFEDGQNARASDENLLRRVERIEGRLDQLDRVESKLDRLLTSQEPGATAAARKKARELGVNLLEVEGSGSGGQITVGDVRKKGEG